MITYIIIIFLIIILILLNLLSIVFLRKNYLKGSNLLGIELNNNNINISSLYDKSIQKYIDEGNYIISYPKAKYGNQSVKMSLASSTDNGISINFIIYAELLQSSNPLLIASGNSNTTILSNVSFISDSFLPERKNIGGILVFKDMEKKYVTLNVEPFFDPSDMKSKSIIKIKDEIEVYNNDSRIILLASYSVSNDKVNVIDIEFSTNYCRS